MKFICLSILLSIFFNSSKAVLTRHFLTDYPEAKCLDGSSPVYYYEAGSGEDKK